MFVDKVVIKSGNHLDQHQTVFCLRCDEQRLVFEGLKVSLHLIWLKGLIDGGTSLYWDRASSQRKPLEERDTIDLQSLDPKRVRH